MTAGVPGAGIGGLFYLAGALVAPVVESVRARREEVSGRRAWRFSMRLAGLAAGMLAGMAAIAWLLGMLLIPAPGAPESGGGGGVGAAAVQVVGRAAIYLMFGTLAAVLIGVEILRLVVRPTPVHPRADATGTAGGACAR